MKRRKTEGIVFPVGSLHPVVKMVCFLIVVPFLSRGYPGVMGAVLALLFLVWLAGGKFALSSVWRLLRQIRWLLVSILVTYFWFTPGIPLFSSLGSYSPSWQGVAEGSERVAVLILLVTMVVFLLRSMDRQELIFAVRWLVTPLKPIGIERDRFALRLVLALDGVDTVRYLLVQRLERASSERGRLSRTATALAGVFHDVTKEAESRPPQTVVLPGKMPVPLSQWLLPFLLLVLFVSIIWL